MLHGDGVRSLLLDRLGIELPIIQAPMAGISTPAMAAAVSNAGGLGSLGLGSLDADAACEAITSTRRATDRPFGVNVFCNQPPVRNPAREAAWLARLAPHFAAVGASPPSTLRPPYGSFLEDDAMLAMLLSERPPVVSFHFGLPPPSTIRSLRDAGIALLASATSLSEARAVEAAALDGVIAQGWEAGGHRGVFDPDAPDEQLATTTLTRVLVAHLRLPVVAAGGIMDGAGIAACLADGAAAAQLGTAFLACPESAADAGFRATLASPAAEHTVMTRAISGRPARCLANRFTALDVDGAAPPAYPVAYAAAKALHAAARTAGEWGWGAYWAGRGAPRVRTLSAATLVEQLRLELVAAR